jgi:hypothetical protein
MIIIINLHGLTSLNAEGTCELLPMPENMRVTFLDATPCGVTNLSYAGYWKKMLTRMIHELGDSLPTKEFAEACQRDFRKGKQDVLDKIDFLKIASEEEMLAFRRNKGWDMVEYTTDYVNKKYEEDPDPKMKLSEVLVVYSKYPVFTDTKLSPVYSRESLLHYLHTEGVRHPLI